MRLIIALIGFRNIFMPMYMIKILLIEECNWIICMVWLSSSLKCNSNICLSTSSNSISSINSSNNNNNNNSNNSNNNFKNNNN